MHAWIRLAIAVIFLAALALPGAMVLARMASGTEADRSQSENRRLAQFATLFENLRDGEVPAAALAQRIDTAFYDQLPIRPRVTRWTNSVLVYGFHHATGVDVTLGEQGYWFRTETPSYAHLACAAPGGVDADYVTEFVDVQARFQARWAARGVPVYLIVIPKKSSVVPQFLPEFLRQRCETRPNPTELVVEQLRARGAAVAYDLDWFRDQGVETIFDRRSYHWDDGAGARYFQYLFAEGLLAQTGITPSPIEGDGRLWSAPIDLAAQLGIGPLEYSMHRPRLPERLQGVWNGVEWQAQSGEDFSRHFNRGAAQRVRFMQGREGTGRALYFGDSFSRRPDEYFARHMTQSMLLWTREVSDRLQPGRMDALIEDFHPAFVVLVVVESKLAVVDPEQTRDLWSAFMPAGEGWADSPGG